MGMSLHTTLFPVVLTHMHIHLITLASVSSLCASWLHSPLCWFCSGHLVVVGAAVQLARNGSTAFPPISLRCLETLCLEVSFPLTISPATSARGRSLTTSPVKGKEFRKLFVETVTLSPEVLNCYVCLTWLTRLLLFLFCLSSLQTK